MIRDIFNHATMRNYSDSDRLSTGSSNIFGAQFWPNLRRNDIAKALILSCFYSQHAVSA